MVFNFAQKPIVLSEHVSGADKCEVVNKKKVFEPRRVAKDEKSTEKTKNEQIWTKKGQIWTKTVKPVEILELEKSMPFSDYDQFLPGKHYSMKDYDDLFSWLFPVESAESEVEEVDESLECNPSQQMKTLKKKLEKCEQTLDCIEAEHNAQSGKDKFVLFGLAGVATLVLTLYFTR